MTLNDPFPGEKAPKVLSPADAEAEGAGFMAAMAQIQGGF